MFNIAINIVNFGICVVNFKKTFERRKNSTMREVQRHNFEFIRKEILDLSIEEFAEKIGVSKSSYQRMKSKSYDAEYYFSPIQKACELADISLNDFSKEYLTKEIYKKNKDIHRHKKTPTLVLSKNLLVAFLLFCIIISCLLFGIVREKTIHAKQILPSNTSTVVGFSSQTYCESENICYWTDKEGGSYHLNRNCHIIKNRKNIESGTLEEAKKMKKVDPCDFCAVK